MRIAGIDPSIFSTGMVIMDLDDKLEVSSIKFRGYTTIEKYAIEEDNVKITHIAPALKYDKMSMPHRMSLAYPLIMEAMEGVQYAGIEDYAYSKLKKGSGSIVQVCEFCGGVRYALFQAGIGYLNYGIRQIKRYATGKGSNEDDEKMPMCLAFKARFPQYYPAAVFDKLRQFESPMADLCDAFWMCEILHQHLRYEQFGEEALSEADLLFLTTTTTAGASSLADSSIIMKGVEYDRPKRKSRKRKKAETGPKT